MRVIHAARSPDTEPTTAVRRADSAKPAGRFAAHLLEMCAVMCIGGGILIAGFFGVAAVVGFSDLRVRNPAFSAGVVNVILAGAMTAWMRFRRMEWQPTLEMVAASLGAGMLLICGYWLGIVTGDALVVNVCAAACVAMVGAMLFRVRLYTSGHAAHRGHQH
jgi:hypothetical protein